MVSGSINVIYSNEDCVFYLNPQISFFKSIYRKYTNFILADRFVHNIGKSNTINIVGKAYGDLLLKISLLYEESNTDGLAVAESDHPLTKINSIKLALQGNLQIETLNSNYLKMYFKLKYLKKHNIFYENVGGNLVCNGGDLFQKMSLCGGCFNNASAESGSFNLNNITKISATIPLPFSFTKDIGRALPLFLINNKNGQDLNITINYKDTSSGTLPKINLLLKVAYLSNEEQQRFRTTNNEYLMDKVYFQNINKTNYIFDLSESLPNRSIKEIFIENKDDLYTSYRYDILMAGISMLNFSQDSSNGNHDYFSKIKINESFDGFNAERSASSTIIKNNIAYIPFCLHHKSSAPSGTINTSSGKIDLSFLKLDTVPSDLQSNIYITYYSILKINDGNVSLLYDYT